ncbi:hypothetical protein BT93_B2308 [Corymbia citriodora subsp. variegata]|nr:hypothetical protein BT93_B2308 [Corymbia citriodora subsp. variegata]
MGSSRRSFIATFLSILALCVMCSLVITLHQEAEVGPTLRAKVPRRMRLSSTIMYMSLSKAEGGGRDPQKLVKANLRTAPPSKSNPSQNNKPQHGKKNN